jgi:CRISPR/Cas system CMR-associated protein Cmr5 small subunit
MNRSSADLAQLAFGAVDQQTDDTKKCRARARDLPVLLQRNGLLATAALVDARASSAKDWKFVRDALVGLHNGSGTLVSVVSGMTEARYREQSQRSREFAWWLKRAAEATWTS